jgi:TIR domain
MITAARLFTLAPPNLQCDKRLPPLVRSRSRALWGAARRRASVRIGTRAHQRSPKLPDIFLSYNRDDQAVARCFAEAFEAQGFGVWWDSTLRAGEAYDEVTEAALRRAKAVVVLCSKKSVVSRWVRAEATLADRNRTLVPVMIEPCERPIPPNSRTGAARAINAATTLGLALAQ